jgi:hypothetical protein
LQGIEQKRDVKDNGDLDGPLLMCQGRWSDPDNCISLMSALSCVHENTHGRKGDYVEKCNACAIRNAEGLSGNCGNHNDVRVARGGNVVKSTLVKNTRDKITKESNHQIDGAAHTARKKAYLFACLIGCSDVVEMMRAADHETPQVAG